MHFITLVKLRRRPTKEEIQEMEKALRNPKPGTKVRFVFWTLGRYDMVFYTEGPDERTALSTVFPFLDFAATETLVAVTREDALKVMGV
ncbi:MAG: GYD domain-containing protein [archaeon]|nr:GYD domain-containing protein [archaeon]